MLTFVEVIKVYVESALQAFYLGIKGIRGNANFIRNIVSKYLTQKLHVCAEKRGLQRILGFHEPLYFRYTSLSAFPEGKASESDFSLT